MQPNISVITEDIYLKLRVVVHYQKENDTSRKGNPLFFWTKLCPFFDLEFSNEATAERWHPHAVLLFYYMGCIFAIF